MHAFLRGWQVTIRSAPDQPPCPTTNNLGNDAPWHLHNMDQFAVPSFAFWNNLTFGGKAELCVRLVHSNGQPRAPEGSPYRIGSGLVLLPRALWWDNGRILDGWRTSTPPPPIWCTQL